MQTLCSGKIYGKTTSCVEGKTMAPEPVILGEVVYRRANLGFYSMPLTRYHRKEMR